MQKAAANQGRNQQTENIEKSKEPENKTAKVNGAASGGGQVDGGCNKLARRGKRDKQAGSGPRRAAAQQVGMVPVGNPVR